MLPRILSRLPERVMLGCACSRSEEHTSELQSQSNLVCRLLLEKKKKQHTTPTVSQHTTGNKSKLDTQYSHAHVAKIFLTARRRLYNDSSESIYGPYNRSETRS